VSGWAFRFSDEVRFGDLDAMGHLNNVAFLAFFESARVAYVCDAVPGHQPAAVDDFGFMVVEVALTYRSPAHYGERIDTQLAPGWIGRSSFSCRCEMSVGERVLAEGHAVMVTYDSTAQQPIAIPERLRTRLVADGAQPRGEPNGGE
jgi:acyl-CoA thioester hydrolase